MLRAVRGERDERGRRRIMRCIGKWMSNTWHLSLHGIKHDNQSRSFKPVRGVTVKGARPFLVER